MLPPSAANMKLLRYGTAPKSGNWVLVSTTVPGITADSAPVGAAPWLLGHASAVYGLVAVLAGVLLAALARRLHGAEGARADQAARQLFAYSVLYLFVLFAMLLIDQGLGGLFGRAAA